MVATDSSRADRTSIQRPLGGTEKIYWLLDKLYSLNFVAYVELEGKLETDDLDRALASVQEETPLLRSRIVVADKNPVFEPVEPASYPLRVETMKLRGWRRQLEQLLDIPFAAGDAPLARFLWFRGTTDRSVAAMVFHHPIADGRSGLHILLHALRRATDAASEFAYRPARPSTQELDLIHGKRLATRKLQEARFWLEKGRESLSMAGRLPGYDMNPTDQRESRSIELSVPKARSSALMAACRAHKTSVHGALGAAQVLSLNDEFAQRKARVMALNSLADLRGVLDGGLTEQDLGLYVSTLTTVHSLGARPDFWRLAGEIRHELQRVITSGDADLIHSFYPRNRLFTPDEHGARLVQKIIALAPASSMLTNIGKVDPINLGSTLSARQAGFLLSPPPQSPICVTASSYKGRILLNMIYDSSKISTTRARRIADNLLHYLEVAAA